MLDSVYLHQNWKACNRYETERRELSKGASELVCCTMHSRVFTCL